MGTVSFPKRVNMHLQHPRRLAGSVLLIVVVLLLLASLFVVFALNVGKFEQKTSGNDVRAKLAQELAESGIHQGAEYFAGNPAIRTNMANWEQCTPPPGSATDMTFPCGAIVETGVDPDGGGPLVAPARKINMYRFIGGTGTGFAKRLLPLPAAITATGGFPASQQVGAVLCRIKKPTSATDPTACATDDSEASSIWVLTLVSKGSLTDEGSSATAVQTIGSYGVFNLSPNIPPVIASGTVDVGGGIQIVTAANGGGLGVGSDIPVSVWTRLEMTKAGTPNTCYMWDFLSSGGTGQIDKQVQYYPGTDVEVCDTCKCPLAKSLSYLDQGGGNKACQGIDIVDIDNNEPNDAGCPVAANLDIKRSEFPPDLFAFVFGISAWKDEPGGTDTYANKGFNFGETRLESECKFPHPQTKAETTALLPEDTCYLLKLNNIVHIGDGVNDATECAAVGSGSAGIIWVHSQPIQSGGATVAGMSGYGCDLKNVDQIGTPLKPVALIHDGSLGQIHFELYGLLFIREPNASKKLVAETGGSAILGPLNAGTTIYGAVIVQGQLDNNGGGSAAIVYSEKVLKNLVNDPDLAPDPTALPGSWTDRVRY